MKRILAVISLIILSACDGAGSKIDSGFLSQVASPSPTPAVTFSQDYPFAALTNATYSFSSSTTTDLTGGIVELTASSQSDSTSTDFNNGAYSGTAWDGTNNYLRLSNNGGCDGSTLDCAGMTELSASWTPQWANLIGYWKFNGSGAIANGTSIPAVVGPNAAAVNTNGTGMSYATGKVNQGINFDGTDDSVTIPASVLSAVTTDLSIQTWIYPTAFGTYKSLFDTAARDLCIFINTSSNGYYGMGTVTSVMSWSPAFTLNQWQHVVFVKSGTNGYVYINGTLSSTVGPVGATYNQAISIGGNPSGGGSPFVGYQDEIAVWKTALSATEVQTLYGRQSMGTRSGTFTSRAMDAWNAGQTWTSFNWIPTLPFLKSLPDAGTSETTTNYSSIANSTLMGNIIGLWHLDEAAGTSGAGSIKDQSGNTNHGTPTAVTLGASGALGTAGSFNGTTSMVVSANNTGVSGDTPLTMSIWVYPTTTTAGMALSTGDASTALKAAGLFVNGTGAGSFSFEIAGNTGVRSANGIFSKFQWHHLAVTKTTGNINTSVILYLDGNPVSGTASSATMNLTNTPVRIGEFMGFGANYTGLADEAAIWGRALSATEIRQLYRRGANRIKYQARTCTAANCTDDPTGANWKGPDGTSLTYFSELYNMSTQSATPSGTVGAGLPTMTLANFTSPPAANRYFQYRAIMESDDVSTGCNYSGAPTWCSPELKSVAVAPIHYDSSTPTVGNAVGISYHSLTSLSETLGSTNGCVGGSKYILSPDGATWYWYTAGAWAVSNGTYAQSNSAVTFTAPALSTFAAQAGTGNLFFKAFLKSNGTQACEIDDLLIGGNQ